ncbi:VC0807 family protein [Streptomyces sp. NPDC001404]|uniref:VC0807 family protein n=1 Tax=Streptomyces sp. NPDC001404 TaxID=3364571 RepID=UPI0036C29C88
MHSERKNGQALQEQPAGEQSAAVRRPTEKEKAAGLRRHLARQLLLELALPLGSYYGLRAAGWGQWQALAVGALLSVPWIVHGMVRQRRVDATALFSLVLMFVGTLMAMVTGDARVLLIRDSWIFGLMGLWVLGTLPTRRPFILTMGRTIAVAKTGDAGARDWESRWEQDEAFRRHIRVISAVWGAVFTLDAGVRVVLACTLPVDLIVAVSTAQWLVVLAGLLTFHTRYVTRHGLKA